MDAAVRRLVLERAEGRCEYCRLPSGIPIMPPFHIEHITPKKHGGSDRLNNLATACHHCNLAKSSNLTGIDRLTNEVTPLFNPRTATWSEHFVLHQLKIGGRTAVGRTTVRVLNMNTFDRMRLRSKLSAFNLTWPG